ncbi:MAG: hypothetical protein BM556_17860 [Bacteriovorax sp. MedPE-SWde]|nr:MAG: hypothetical protein BM556_17860 [Bacteriovorax sp. MedPE-SWde]
MIAAMGKNRELGLDNKLLWKIPADMKNFVKVTKGKPIIVGRKTFESFGRPLPKRLNVVITRNKDYKYDHENVVIFHDPQAAVNFLKDEGYEESVVCGGAFIYEIYMNEIDRLYLSRVDWQGEADTFFPPFDEGKFKLDEEIEFEATDETPFWKYEVYKR